MTKKRYKKKITLYKGLPIIDSDNDLEINITKNDVLRAKRNEPANCAAAIATKRILGKDVEVHISRTYVKSNKKWIRYLTPESIAREIVSFDRAGIFDPGNYIFKTPTISQRLGNPRSGHQISGKKNRKQHSTNNIRESAK